MFFIRPFFLFKYCFPKAIWRLTKEESKTIYLTFDDGPIPEVTTLVLDLLHQHQVKATFFCVGENVVKYSDLYAEILKQGHQVGNHSFNHMQAFKSNRIEYLENIEKANNYIESNLFRPSHGQLTLRLYQKIREKYKIVMWDVLSGDHIKRFSVERIVENVLNNVRGGSIIVFHDSLKTKDKVLQVLPIIISTLKKQNYQFNTINI